MPAVLVLLMLAPSAAPPQPVRRAVEQILFEVVVAQAPADDWVALGRPGHYAYHLAPSRAWRWLASSPSWLGGAREAARRLLLRGKPASQSHLDGVLAAGRHQAFADDLARRGRAKVMAQPRTVVMSGSPCAFLVRTEHPVPVPAGYGSVGVQFEEVGFTLRLSPDVTRAGRVSLDAEVEVGDGPPTKRSVELEPGQSLVLTAGDRIAVVSPRVLVPGE